MPKLQKNVRVIASAIGGSKMVYQIDGAPGLNLAALGNGKASWRLRYRPTRGAEKRWHTIGDARTVTLGDAIDKARELMSSLQIDGVDPRCKFDKPKGQTFDGLFNQWLERRAKVHKRSWKDDEERYRLHIARRLGSRLVTDIGRRDVIGALNDIADSVSPITANRCLSIISVVYSWAVSVELVEQHPALRIPKPGIERVRERVLTLSEIGSIWNSLTAIVHGERDGMTPMLARLLQVLLLTGQRKSEVANMPVKEVTGDLWVIPGERMKAKRQHLVPLAPIARATIQSAMIAAGSNPLVFPGRDGGMLEPMSVGHAFVRLTKSLGIINVRPHDLRRTVASEMGRLGIGEQIISRVLAHTQTGITSRVYNLHGYSDEKRDALNRWEAELVRISTQA